MSCADGAFHAADWCASASSLAGAGHGSQQRDYSGEETDGLNETLCPLDFRQAGEIVDDELNRWLVNPLPTVGFWWLACAHWRRLCAGIIQSKHAALCTCCIRLRWHGRGLQLRPSANHSIILPKLSC
jgi:hypothetical protein